jgi:hypothetical protein
VRRCCKGLLRDDGRPKQRQQQQQQARNTAAQRRPVAMVAVMLAVSFAAC